VLCWPPARRCSASPRSRWHWPRRSTPAQPTRPCRYSLGFTGIAIHEWLGIGLGVVLLVHLTLHWDWVIRTTRKLVCRGGRERVVWLVNLLLLLSMTLCIASGILISQVALPRLGITLPASSFWRQVHGTTATLTLILVPIHAALRWRWIVGVARRFAAWRPGRSR
jgi:hypothetical protein